MSNSRTTQRGCEIAVIWIDWYAYHVARFRGLNQVPLLAGKVAGIELVSGVGVHPGLRFREDLPEELRVETLMPGVSWSAASKIGMARLLWKRLDALKPGVVSGAGLLHAAGNCRGRVGPGAWTLERADDREHGFRSQTQVPP